MSDWRQEYERRRAGHRDPNEVYRDMKACRNPYEMADLANEFISSMEAHEMVLYAP